MIFGIIRARAVSQSPETVYSPTILIICCKKSDGIEETIAENTMHTAVIITSVG